MRLFIFFLRRMVVSESLTVLIIGSGAREHAISSAYEKSPRVGKIVVAPGNDFIAYKRKKEIIVEKECGAQELQKIYETAKKHKADIVDVAQDNALANGTVDFLKKRKFTAFGPTKHAAEIEWNKAWSRSFMVRKSIPAPEVRIFSDGETAVEHLKHVYAERPDKPLYIKASGLCAGKGALKAENLCEATWCVRRMKDFGDAGKTFVIEDGLEGEEFSYYAISDGKTYRVFKSAQDNKRVFNNDEGEQTGGMGVVSPAKVTEQFAAEIVGKQIERALNGMRQEKRKYKGILYLGGIISDGKPMTIEYNARWGDPECQTILPSLDMDYAELVLACCEERLDDAIMRYDKKTRVCVVGASRGYPNDYSAVKGKKIHGLDEAMATPGATVFGAGVDICEGEFCANGGRLFSVVGEGKDVIEARERAYAAISKISVEGNNLHYRTDIGWRDVERSRTEARV